MSKGKPSLSERCKQVKQITMAELLEWLGVHAVKEDKGERWYLSPFRQEAEASFKITRDRRAWFDHGAGEGGNILDFAMAFFRTDLRGAVEELERMQGGAPAPEPVRPALPVKTETPKDTLTILSLKPITSRSLKLYLEKRGIPLEVANPYLKEMHYERGEKLYFSLAFANESGGYELRNAYFKGVHGTKDITLIQPEGSQESESVAVFEGVMDFLSAIVLARRPPRHPVIVMNSVAMKDRSLERIRDLGAKTVDFYLDRDEAGEKLLREFREVLTGCDIHDRSGLYAGHKDVNDWLVSPE